MRFILLLTLIPALCSAMPLEDMIPSEGMNDMVIHVEHGVGAKERRMAVKGEQYRWKNGVIPYTVALPVYTEKNLKEMREALDEFEKETCLKFVKANQSTPNYLVVRAGAGGCQAELGKVPDEPKRSQFVNLGNGCRWYGLYLHEFGHSIGLYHEHQHPQRDSGVNVFKQNVDPTMAEWFDINQSPFEAYGAPYDIQSIMHYGETAFGKWENGKQLITMKTKDPKMQKYLTPVYLKDMSFYDAYKINHMYKCAAKCGNVSCKDGYVTKDCKCETKQSFAKRRCINKDGDSKCAQRAKNNGCVNYRIQMYLGCRKACDRCYDAI